jgi:hypothetical protein
VEALALQLGSEELWFADSQSGSPESRRLGFDAYSRTAPFESLAKIHTSFLTRVDRFPLAFWR